MYERFFEGLDSLLNISIVLGTVALFIIFLLFLDKALSWAWFIANGLFWLAMDKIKELSAKTERT